MIAVKRSQTVLFWRRQLPLWVCEDQWEAAAAKEAESVASMDAIIIVVEAEADATKSDAAICILKDTSEQSLFCEWY